MSCQDCLNRRDFLAKSALAAAALAVLEGCGDGQIGPTAAKLPPGGVSVTLAEFPDLATVGAVVAVKPEIALVRTGTTTFVAFSRICTHEGCVTDVVKSSNRFECPCHGSIFSNTGAVVRGPNGQSGGIRPLDQLATRFDATAGTVTITT